MGIMGSTLYLPEEVLSFRNYPEAATTAADVQSILAYSEKVSTAISNYTSSTLDRIDLSIYDLQKYVALCRDVCSTLGNAQNVCYDLLVELRAIQDILQTLVFTKNRYGSQYIGTPTNGG